LFFEYEYESNQRQGATRNPSDVMTEAKEFLTKGLISLLEDFNISCKKLDEIITSQEISIESLIQQNDFLQTKLTFAHNQPLVLALDEMRMPTNRVGLGSEPGVVDVPIEEVLPASML
jgi:hypothetical protein